jgi:hypothetical protein
MTTTKEGRFKGEGFDQHGVLVKTNVSFLIVIEIEIRACIGASILGGRSAFVCVANALG